MKSTFKSAVSGHIASSKTKSKETETRHEKNFAILFLEPEDNAESCIRCLKYDNLSVAEFDQCWKACARYRLTQIKKLASTKSIMETWPFYKAPSGYRLIDIDYKICFDGSDGLILNWKKYFDVLVKFLSSSGNDKDKKIKGLVEKVRDAPDLPENGKNAAIFWALHRNENLIKEAISKNEFLNQVLKGKKRLQAVVDAMYPREVAADEIIINEGSVGTQLYISASGSYEITIKGESIFKFEDNRVFGLVAILYNVKRLATIQALTKGNIWVLDQNVYQKLINLKTEIELAFLEKVSKLNTVSKQVLSRATDLNWKFYRTRYIAVTKESKAKFSARINMSGNPGPSRMHPDDSGFEKWCTDLLEDEDCVISDEDEDPDFIIESEHDSDSEMSAGEEGDENLDTGPGGAQTQENFYYGRQKLQKIKQNGKNIVSACNLENLLFFLL
ncbi:hypothetical protein RN001_007722 [Aquatica leii]|uniref:cAMP-dependent protein kinase type II-alpha regulatory subunit n=1 Tax=Aquatica leii TaxID=1421715 RepID=A0AAN7PDJ1_9COLE|nr:hypothetical protein RN001_007722 [Aquatica leii]